MPPRSSQPATTTSATARAGATAQNIADRSTRAVEKATVHTPIGDAPILPLLLIGLGGYFMWFAVKYWRDQDVKWPSDPIKSVLQGKGLPQRTESATVAAELSQAIATAQAEAPGPAGSPGTTGSEPALPSSGAYSESQLETIWKLAGGPADQATFAAGVALAESSGNPKVTSSNPDGGTNVGLWQLDTKGVGTGHTVAQLQNPATNAKITVAATNKGTNWQEWSDSYTATHGTGGANSAANKAAGNPGGP